MPFQNEHRARQADPSNFERFRRGKPEGFPAGVEVIFGFKPGGGSEIQSVIFNASNWSPARAKQWLRDHGFKTGNFEGASPREKTASEDHFPTKSVTLPFVPPARPAGGSRNMDTNETLNKLAGQLTSVLKGDNVQEMGAEELLAYSIEQITKAASDPTEEARKERLDHLHKTMAEARKTLGETPDAKVEVEIFDTEAAEPNPVADQLKTLGEQIESLKASIEVSERTPSPEADETATVKPTNDNGDEETGFDSGGGPDGEVQAEKSEDETSEETSTEDAAEETSEETSEEDTEAESTEDNADETPAEDGGETEVAASDETPAGDGDADVEKSEDAQPFEWPSNLNTPEFRGKTEEKTELQKRQAADRDWGEDPPEVKEGYFENRPR